MCIVYQNSDVHLEKVEMQFTLLCNGTLMHLFWKQRKICIPCAGMMDVEIVVKLKSHNHEVEFTKTCIFVTLLMWVMCLLMQFKDFQTLVLCKFLYKSSISKILHHISFLLINLAFRMPINLYSSKKFHKRY